MPGPDYLQFKSYMESQRQDVEHHGILGMHWGIRRFQPYPKGYAGSGKEVGEALRSKKEQKNFDKAVKSATKSGVSREYFSKEHTLPKGTKVYRTSIDEKNKINGYTYVSYLKPDRNLYKGGNIRARENADKSYEHVMTLTEDLKIPSRKEVKEITNSIMRQNPDLVKESVNSWYDVIFPKGSYKRYEMFRDSSTDEVNEKYVKKAISDTIKEYKDYSIDDVFYITMQSLGLAKNSKKAIITELEKRGYNAMVDEAGVGLGLKEGVDPLIIFNSKKTLSTERTNEISRSEESKAENEYLKWKKKARTRGTGEWHYYD